MCMSCVMSCVMSRVYMSCPCFVCVPVWFVMVSVFACVICCLKLNLLTHCKLGVYSSLAWHCSQNPET